MTLTEQNIAEFQSKLGINASAINMYDLFQLYFVFLDVSYRNFVNFFLGNRNSLDYEDVNTLNVLKRDFEKLNGFMRNSQLYDTYQDWEFFDLITDMRENLYMIDNLGKFLKSSSKQARTSSSYTFLSTKGKGKTLERVAFDTLESQNYDEDWVDIALDNDLAERDYSINESKLITLRIQLNSRNTSLTNFVDNPDGDNILGKDLDRNFTFEDNDVKVLTPKETFEQVVNILANLKKYEVPEFIQLGQGKFVGDNTIAFGYGALLRQLSETFSSDDSIASFSVKDLYLNEGDLTMEIVVESVVPDITRETVFKF